MKEGIKLHYLPHDYELLQERVKQLEEFALVVVNNSGGNSYARLPDRPDLFEWLTKKYQHQMDAFFDEIEELECQVESLKNRVNHDPRL